MSHIGKTKRVQSISHARTTFNIKCSLLLAIQ